MICFSLTLAKRVQMNHITKGKKIKLILFTFIFRSILQASYSLVTAWWWQWNRALKLLVDYKIHWNAADSSIRKEKQRNILFSQMLFIQIV